MSKKKGKHAETKPESGEGVPGLPKPEGNAGEVAGAQPEPAAESKKEGTTKDPSTVKTDKLPERATAAAAVEAPKPAVATPDGHPDTLSDPQKEYIHAERKRELDAAMFEIDKRVKLMRETGHKSCSIAKKYMEVRGVKDLLLTRKFTIDRSEDPGNYQLGFPKKG